MSAIDIHAPDFAKRLTAALVELTRAEMTLEQASEAAITDLASPMAARRLVVATMKLGEAQAEWKRCEEVLTTSVRLELCVAEVEHAHG